MTIPREGLEEYTVTNGPDGQYKVQVHFFSDHRQGGGPPVECTVIVLRDNREVERQPIRLTPGQTSQPFYTR